MGKELRSLWKAAGGMIPKGYDTIDDWQTEAGGGCVVMSAGQSKLGYPCDLLLVDDPLEENQYQNKEVRDTVDKTITLYTARCATHLNSVLIVASRWHQDDPIGRRLSRKAAPWIYIANAGIIRYGTSEEHAFAPDVLSLEGHHRMRREWGEQDPSLKTWYAQVQNDPRPDALGMFREPVRGPAPAFGRYVIGLDLAYSGKEHADYFAMVVIKIWESRAYVCNVIRERRNLESASAQLQTARRIYPGAALWSYISGPEKGAIDYLNGLGIPVQGMRAATPKYNRAQRTIDAWNVGTIVLPEQAAWVDGFVTRCSLFTGNEDAGDDDEIDALVSACDGGLFSTGFVAKSFGKPRM